MLSPICDPYAKFVSFFNTRINGLKFKSEKMCFETTVSSSKNVEQDNYRRWQYLQKS